MIESESYWITAKGQDENGKFVFEATSDVGEVIEMKVENRWTAVQLQRKKRFVVMR